MTEPPLTPPEIVKSAHTAEATAPDFTAALSAEAIDPRKKLPRLPTPHANKFRIALALLCGIATGAIAVAVIAISNHTSDHSTVGSRGWSQWSPSTTGTTGAQEIADYVAPFYRLNAGQQLDVITPIALTSATAAGTTTGHDLTIAVNSGGSASSSSLSLLTGSTVAYNICGVGATGCQLSGTASASRLLLLRREALEVALYTLKYLPSVDNVLVVLPPGHNVSKVGAGVTTAKPVTVAVLFLRAELKPLLSTPIDDSLEEIPPDIAQLAAWSKSDEAGLVDEVTARTLFSEQVEAQQEGGNLLVLSPLASQ